MAAGSQLRDGSSRLALAVALAVTGTLLTSPAVAGSFDAMGRYRADPEAVVSEGFEGEMDRYLPEDGPVECEPEAFSQLEAADALQGERLLSLDVEGDCAERFAFELPAERGSYRATLWLRHGSLDAQIHIDYLADSERDNLVARLFPTGRITSDGWLELTTNDFPVDGAFLERCHLQVVNFGDVGGVELDALEIVPSGQFLAPQSCTGVGDPACSAEEVCLYNQCRLGRLSVPPLPPDGLRDQVVDVLQSQLRVFYGGRKTRLYDLPDALLILESLRHVSTAWQFWNGWAHAINRLHDWHTGPSSAFRWQYPRTRRLNLCFFEGDGDASQQIWPTDPRFKDILVSHVGEGSGTHGIHQGDRLVAVDGLHPIEWGLGLIDVDWGFWQASDDEVFTEIAERLRSSIIAYATDFSVVHCHAATGSCDPVPQTYVVAELPQEEGGQVNCDHRPFYHLQGDNNPGPNHHISGFYRAPVQDTTPEEAIYGMIWDTLWGAGDPNGWFHTAIDEAIADFKANARGVILDHRQSPGGTVDAPEHVTELVRPQQTALVFASPIQQAGYDGPATPQEGMDLFQALEGVWGVGFTVGSPDHDPDLPVALILHRNGSASDFLAFGMQGAPRVRIFGPHGIAGAYSTYHQFSYWGGLSLTLASGDSISPDGRSHIGYAVVPDELVDQRQSDLLSGVDTLHEAALAWVRQELEP